MLSALKRFAGLVGVPVSQAEDALHHAGHAKLVLSRRAFFGIVGASAAAVGLPASSAFAFPERLDAPIKSDELYLSLHTATPGRFGAHEVSYGGYARVRVERTEMDPLGKCQSIAFPPASFGFAAVGFLMVRGKEGSAVLDIRGGGGQHIPISAGIIPSVRLGWKVS